MATDLGDPSEPTVRLLSMAVGNRANYLVGGRPVVRGVHFAGAVREWVTSEHPHVFRTPSVRFEQCRMDSGLAIDETIGNYAGTIELTQCRIYGQAQISSENFTVDSCQFSGAGLLVKVDGSGEIRDNLVEDAPDIGINSLHGGFDAYVHRNLVCRAGEGIVGAYVDSNVVINCRAGGIRSGLPDGQFGANASIRNNRVTGCGGIGIDAEGRHITVEGNVVGRCGGHGVRATGGYCQLSSNTIYRNGGSGIRVDGGFTVGCAKNISAANGAFGVEWAADLTPSLECNDWFANASGATSGVLNDSTDLSIDPLFCNMGADSVGLANDSPLLNAPGCGLIGALGEGCVDLATGTLTPGRPKEQPEHLGLALLPPMPNPARLGARIAYTLPCEMKVRMTVIDVTGRVVGVLADDSQGAGRHEIVWGGPASAARAGVYFVRLEAGGGRFLQRVLIVP